MGIAPISQGNSAAAHLRSVQGNGRVGATRRVDSGTVATTMGPGVVTDINAQNLDMRVAIRGVNRSISMLESADGAAEKVQEGLRRTRELAVAAGNESLPERIREGIAGKFDEAMHEIAGVSKNTAYAGNPLADGSARFGMVDGEETPLPATDMRMRTLGIDGIDSFELWSSQSRYDVIDRIDSAIAEVAAQRTEISAAAVEVTAQTGGSVRTAGQDGIGQAEMARVRADRGSAEDSDFAQNLAETLHETMQDAAQRGALGTVHTLDRGATLRVLSQGA